MLHGLGIGTDTGRDWVFYLTIVCCCAVAVAVIVRIGQQVGPARRSVP